MPSPTSVFDSFGSPLLGGGGGGGGGADAGGSRGGGTPGSAGGIRSLRTHLVPCHEQWPAEEE